MLNEKILEVEIDYDEQKIYLIYQGEKTDIISFEVNPYHAQNYYLNIAFERIDLCFAKRIFDEVARKLGRPLQVMISSEEVNKIALLDVAGFQCKRKCYEVEAQRPDYVGENSECEILYSHMGEEAYEKCRELMLNRYIMTHAGINPWTGSSEEFFKELPDCVGYICADGELSCFAFLEDEEIAYVYGKNVQEFRKFSQALVSEMFRKYEFITFEADDCDDMAMELKSLFVNQSEESFDTYICTGNRKCVKL